MLCVQVSCAVRREGSKDDFVLSTSSYFVGIIIWAVSSFKRVLVLCFGVCFFVIRKLQEQEKA